MAFRATLDSTSSVGSDDVENQNVLNGSMQVTRFRIVKFCKAFCILITVRKKTSKIKMFLKITTE